MLGPRKVDYEDLRLPMKRSKFLLLACLGLCLPSQTFADEVLSDDFFDLLAEAIVPPPTLNFQTDVCHYRCPNGVTGDVFTAGAVACWQVCEDFCQLNYSTGCGGANYGLRQNPVSSGSGGNVSAVFK